MKRLLLALLLGASAPAMAQVNTVPQTGLNTGNLRQATYSAQATNLVPAAAATDLFCIAASPTRNIGIRQILITGIAGTLTNVPFILVRHTIPDTGGTAATGISLPIAVPHSSLDQAATTTITSYTANPTIPDPTPLYLRSEYLTLPTTAAGSVNVPIRWNFGTSVDSYDKGADLIKGTTQQYCISLNAATVTGGSLSISMEWTEQ